MIRYLYHLFSFFQKAFRLLCIPLQTIEHIFQIVCIDFDVFFLFKLIQFGYIFPFALQSIFAFLTRFFRRLHFIDPHIFQLLQLGDSFVSCIYHRLKLRLVIFNLIYIIFFCIFINTLKICNALLYYSIYVYISIPFILRKTFIVIHRLLYNSRILKQRNSCNKICIPYFIKNSFWPIPYYCTGEILPNHRWTDLTGSYRR